jgi:nucleoside-diphosphate-sugar epimerase
MLILITGCAGFIGSKVTEKLLERGDQVIGIDNMNDYYDPRLKEWRLEQLKRQPSFEFYQIDISNREALEKLFNPQSAIRNPCPSGRRAQFDAIINLAARAGVRASLENPWIYYDTNVTGTLNLLESCRKYGVKKFVLASTSSLYGGNNPLPFIEDANTNQPLSPYASSKKAAEALCYTYHYLYGIDITVLRYFTVYGPAGRPDMSLFRFTKWINEGQPVTIYGDGKQERDFTFVDDIAYGTIAALRPMGYEVINLGSDKPIALINALRIIENLLGKKSIMEYKDRHPADVLATWANIDKARELLNWQPETAFQKGVRQLVDWFLQNRSWVKEVDTL